MSEQHNPPAAGAMDHGAMPSGYFDVAAFLEKEATDRNAEADALSKKARDAYALHCQLSNQANALIKLANTCAETAKLIRRKRAEEAGQKVEVEDEAPL